MRYLLIMCLLLSPVVADAAYNSATITNNHVNDNGAREITVQFRGNANEEVVTRTYTIASRGTAAEAYTELRIWAGGVMAELDIQHLAGTATAVAAGQTITPLPKPSATPTGAQLWQRRYHLLRQFEGHGLTNTALLAELTTLRNWLNTNYQTGYLAGFE